jgi:hypothetical protein
MNERLGRAILAGFSAKLGVAEQTSAVPILECNLGVEHTFDERPLPRVLRATDVNERALSHSPSSRPST